MSLSNPCGVLEPFVVEANEIFQASLSTNTWNSYENGMSGFNKFRKNYNLDVIWPPPVNHISSFIAFLAYNSYTTSTAKTYVSPSKYEMGLVPIPNVWVYSWFLVFRSMLLLSLDCTFNLYVPGILKLFIS